MDLGAEIRARRADRPAAAPNRTNRPTNRPTSSAVSDAVNHRANRAISGRLNAIRAIAVSRHPRELPIRAIAGFDPVERRRTDGAFRWRINGDQTRLDPADQIRRQRAALSASAQANRRGSVRPELPRLRLNRRHHRKPKRRRPIVGGVR
jgi:hypothetical protein